MNLIEMRKKVLIVEDNELNMKLFHDLLEAHDIDTVQTREGALAYDMALEHNPDLIIMDIQLPEISGLDITKQLKENDTLKNDCGIAIVRYCPLLSVIVCYCPLFSDVSVNKNRKTQQALWALVRPVVAKRVANNVIYSWLGEDGC